MTPEQLHCELEKKVSGKKLLLVLDNVSSSMGLFDHALQSRHEYLRDGLPLAARSLGCLLKSRTDVEGWTEILESNVRKQRSEGVHRALRASYDDLPSYL
uniref:NB-ARC domain-containing protein n=1 Tax=Salix viminalis TaxID=40686 RepID=A0A6N2NAE4_SALVM